MSEKDVCKGRIGEAEILTERSVLEHNPKLTMDALNLIYGRGVNKAQGEKNIAALNACNEEKRKADPHLPKIVISPS